VWRNKVLVRNLGDRNRKKKGVQSGVWVLIATVFALTGPAWADIVTEVSSIVNVNMSMNMLFFLTRRN
jgi:hypothetical protein